MTISLTMLTFNCIILSCQKSVPLQLFYMTVHVILIIAFLLYAIRYNVCHLRTLLFVSNATINSTTLKKAYFLSTIFCDSISAAAPMTAMPFSIVRY